MSRSNTIPLIRSAPVALLEKKYNTCERVYSFVTHTISWHQQAAKIGLFLIQFRNDFLKFRGSGYWTHLIYTILWNIAIQQKDNTIHYKISTKPSSEVFINWRTTSENVFVEMHSYLDERMPSFISNTTGNGEYPFVVFLAKAYTFWRERNCIIIIITNNVSYCQKE